MLLSVHTVKYIVWEKQQINTSLAQISEPRWSLMPTAQSANQPYGTVGLQGDGGRSETPPPKLQHFTDELF